MRSRDASAVYDDRDAYVGLRAYEPESVIGHSMMVYDRNWLGRGKLFPWFTHSARDVTPDHRLSVASNSPRPEPRE